MQRGRIAITACVVCLTLATASADAKDPLAQKYLDSGKFALGEQALQEHLKKAPKDDQARFGLGVVQFIQSVETLSQSLYRYGMRSERGRRMGIPFLRLPVPVNPDPETFTYPAARKIFDDFSKQIQKTEATLAGVKDDKVKLPLKLATVQFDLDGDGKPDGRFGELLARYLGGPQALPQNKDLLIAFDRGDVAWLRGYCHLLMTLTDLLLAYDGQELFDCTAHVFFAKVKTPHKFLTQPENVGVWNVGDGVDIVDVIAFIHLMRLPLKEPARMKSALKHLEQMTGLSRESWKHVVAETDDDHEWIPNTKQTGVLGIRINQQMIDAWLEFMDEMDALLAGKRLIPFWRGNGKQGVNLRRVFTEPRRLDLVLWVQGTAATPYLENGPLSKKEVWARLQRVFGGEFVGFAIWFN